MTALPLLAAAAPATPLRGWLQALCLATPPAGLLHIGAGVGSSSGFGETHALYTAATRVVAVEADAARANQLEAGHAALAQLTVRQAVAAARSGPARLIQASIASESGLCPPESLQPIWPRLQAVGAVEVDALSLKGCWGVLQAPPGWLVIECLPAGELLASVPDWLAQADVVVARAVQLSALGQGVGLADHLGVDHLQQMLAGFGMHLLGLHEENHPALVMAVFVRDQRQRVAALEGRLGALDTEVARLKTESSSIARQWQQRLDHEMVRAKSLADDLQAIRAELEAAGKALGDSEKGRQEQQARIGALEGERAALTQLGSEREQQLAQGQQQLEQLKAQEGQLLLERANQQQEAAQRQERLVQLGLERDELGKLAQQSQQELAQTQQELAQTQQELAQTQQELARTRQELAQKQQELEQGLLKIELQTKALEQQQREKIQAAEALAEQERVAAQVAGQHQRQIESLTLERDEIAQVAARRQADTEQMLRARDEQARLASEAKQRIEHMTRAAGELEQRVADLRSRLDQAAQREALLEQDLRQSRQTASLSMKLQAAREADLRDLRSRYQAAAEVQSRQHQLLTKLSERLSVASAYFHQLNEPEPMVEVIEEVPVPAPAKRSTRAKAGKSVRARTPRARDAG